MIVTEIELNLTKRTRNSYGMAASFRSRSLLVRLRDSPGLSEADAGAIEIELQAGLASAA